MERVTEVTNPKTGAKRHLCKLFGGKTQSERTCSFSRLLSHGRDSCDALTTETVVYPGVGVVSTRRARSHTLRTPGHLPKSKELWVRTVYPPLEATFTKLPWAHSSSECGLQILKTQAEGPQPATLQVC